MRETHTDQTLSSVYTETCATDEHLCQCPICLALNHLQDDYCVQCHARLHQENKQSLQVTLALLVTSVLLFFPANFLPMMSTVFFGDKTESTILGGVILLWQQGSYPVALVIFIASIVVPLGKIIALFYLCYQVGTHKVRSAQIAGHLYRMVEFIGKWSMVDVYVVAILVSMLQMGNIISVEPGVASLAFGGLVILTMFAAASFDPRLIWQHVNEGGIDA